MKSSKKENEIPIYLETSKKDLYIGKGSLNPNEFKLALETNPLNNGIKEFTLHNKDEKKCLIILYI